MNWMSKFLLMFMFSDLSLAVSLVILSMCLFILRLLLNFMVVSSVINFFLSDLFTERNRFFTVFSYFFVFLIWGSVDLMLFVMYIRMNMMVNLFDFFYDLDKVCCSELFVSVMAFGLLIRSGKLSFSMLSWNWICFFQSEKLVLLKIEMEEISKWSESGINTVMKFL